MSPKILLSACLGFALIGSAGAATSIGAGTGILSLPGANNAIDTSSNGANDQSRQNVAESDAVNLAAGAYNVTGFTFRAGQTGSVIPYLAVLNGTNSYSVIAVGDVVDVLAGFDPNADVTVAFGGNDSFLLAADVDVYAGTFNPTGAGSQNPIWTNLAVGSVDHDNNADGGISVPSLGGTIDGFGHADLARSYAFEITVDVIPEPSTAALLGLAGLALLRRRRK